jgi:hypothetical protein
MTTTPRQLRPLASVWTAGGGGGDAWAVAETPSEARAIVEAANAADEPFAAFTLANDDDGKDHRWNGRPVYVVLNDITAISPPIDDKDE